MKNLITKLFIVTILVSVSIKLNAQSISLNSAASTSNQTLCINTALMNIEYLVQSGATNATVSGLPNGVTGNYNAGIFKISGTPTESGNFSYTVTTDGNTPATAFGYINVDDVASVGQGWGSMLCVNATATISDFVVSSGTYLWTHDGAGTIEDHTTTMPTYTPAQGDIGNTVTLTLVVTSNNSCPTSTATTTFTYGVKGAPSFTGNLYTYVGSTVQMVGSPGQHQYYPWMSSDGSVATIDNTGLVTGVALGATTITYQDTNNCSISKTLDVVTLVTPSISGNLTICAGSTTQLSGTETAMANNPWTSSNTAVASVSNTGLVTGLTAGTSAITYMNSTGGTSTVNVVIKVTPSVSVNSQTICSGSFAIVTATPSNTGGTYLWGGNETTQNITVNPTVNSNYTVVYTLNGCASNQGLGVVTVNPIPVVNAGTDITVCSGTSITLSGSGAQTYSWSNSVTNGTSFFPSLGSTNYTLTGTSNGCSATDVVNVTVNTTPNLVITNPAVVCSPNTIDVTSPAVTSGSTGVGTLSYWTDANCTSVLGSPSSIINAGPIFIKSTLGSCFDVKQVMVTIKPQPLITGNLSTFVSSTTQLNSVAIAAVNSPWVSSNTGVATVSITGLVTGISAGTTTITFTNTDGCSNTASVIVDALNTISLSSAIGTDNQTVCTNTSITNITYTTSGATGAIFSGLPSGVTGNWFSNEVTLSGTPTNSGVYNYIITLTGGNGSITKSGTINVAIQPNLTITNPSVFCSPSTVDLTLASITAGSTVGGTFSYWIDAAATTSLSNPSAISTSGTYYIKSIVGNCSDVKPVTVTINITPSLVITNPAAVCSPNTVDITTSSITSGSTVGGTTLTYWWDNTLTLPLSNPSAITMSGVYIIKMNVGNCFDIKPVTVTINTTPSLVITNPSAVCSPNTVDITTSSITTGSTVGGTLTYWSDATSTVSLANPSIISADGTYYIKSDVSNCFDIKPVIVTINSTPSLVITNPSPVTSPTTVDITASSITAGSTGNGILTYWINPDASVPLANPTAVDMSGTYFIKSTLGNCSDTNFVTVTINKVSSPTTQLSAYVIPNGISQNGLCDGSAEVVVTSGTAPYTYLFSDNSTNSKAVSLCDGLKSVRIADANKDTLYINFIISSPENLTTTNTFIDSTIIDSVFNNVTTNCILNYSLIDSAKIDSYTILPNDSISLNWKIYTGNSFVVVTNVYSMKVISTAGVYSFALQIYCPNKLSGNFLTAYDQLYITTIDISSSNGLNDLKLDEYSIFPNPFGDQIVIKSKSNLNCEVQLTDLSGKVIMVKSISESDSILNTKDLISGNYLLIIKNDETIKTFKVFK